MSDAGAADLAGRLEARRARLRGARLVVDWHNLAWAVLALGLGTRHPGVSLARWYEGVLGRRADAHLCVSSALAAELVRWGMDPVSVLRDRPAPRFAPLDAVARRQMRRRLLDSLGFGGREPAIVVSPTCSAVAGTARRAKFRMDLRSNSSPMKKSSRTSPIAAN